MFALQVAPTDWALSRTSGDEALRDYYRALSDAHDYAVFAIAPSVEPVSR